MSEKQKRILKIFIFPHWLVKVILVIISAVLLVYSLGYKDANQIVAYCSYPLSAYTLVVVMLKSPDLIRAIKRALHANKYSNKYLSEPILRAAISLYTNMAFNIVYALFYFGMGIFYRSVWTGAIAVYYIVLSLIRFGLVSRDRKKQQVEDEHEQRQYELRSCHACGCLMFLLNIAVTGMVVQMIWQNKYYDYPGFIIYAQAAYTFYCLTRAIMHMIKYRKMERPILSASKVVSLSCAIMSILALQTAMLTQFGDGDMGFVRLMNLLTGSVVCFMEFAMAVWLVHKTRLELRNGKQ